MNLQVRESVPRDMPQVLSLIKELAEFENSPNEVEITVETLIKEGFGEDPLFTCFVAEINEEIVGMALIYYRFSTWKGRTIHLEDLIVKEKMRSKGIGKDLYSKVITYAYKKKVKRIEWAVLDWNVGAIRFYERSGAKVMKNWYITQMEETGIKNYIATL